MKKSEIRIMVKEEVIRESFADNITSALSDKDFYNLLDNEMIKSVITVIEENVDNLIKHKGVEADRDEASRLVNDIFRNYVKHLTKKAKRTRFFGKFKFKNLSKR